jgi:NitT/TauT family transport system substrate-binding protein
LAGFVAGPALAAEGQMRVAKPFGIVYLLRNVIEVSSLLSSRRLKSKATHFGSRSSL